MYSQNFANKNGRAMASKLGAYVALSENGIRKESLFLVCQSEVANNIFSQKRCKLGSALEVVLIKNMLVCV